MLGKLIKHEFKATARLLLPLYLVLLVFTIMDRIALSFHFQGAIGIFTGFVTFAYIVSVIAIIVVSFIIVIFRFYKNLMSDEGYLMFTLPAKSSQLITSKLIVSYAWNLISILAAIVSLLCVFLSPERFTMLRSGWSMFLTDIQKELGSGSTVLIITEFLVMVLLGILNSILMIYASIAIGQLSNGHKLLASFAAYIGISTALQILVTAGSALLGTMFMGFFFDASSIPHVLFPLMIVYALVTSVLFYWITNRIFQKRLNLE